MSATHIAYLACSVATALCALIAAWYWYLSSRPAPVTTDPPDASVSDNPELHILGTQVDLYSIQAALAEASRLNKNAAIWSAVAALLGAASSILGMA
jgi:hypothetical protein